MSKSRVQTALSQSQNEASQSKASEILPSGASGEASLPLWVQQPEVRVSNKNNPNFGARQKQNGLVSACELASTYHTTKLITVAEAAWRLSVSQKTIRRMIEVGNLAVIRLGRSVRIHPEVIEKIIRQNE